METNTATMSYISADSHVIEPPDLWATRMDKHFRDRAPHLESRPNGDYFIIEGLHPFPLDLSSSAIEDKVAGKPIKSPIGRRYEDMRPGARGDVQARLADQDLDHVRAEVVYPNITAVLFPVSDPEYERECFRVANEWLSEFCGAAPKRLLGAASLPMKGPVEWTIKEAKRVAKMGLPSVLIPAEVHGRPYSRPGYEPLWAALQEIGLPVAIHIGTGVDMYEEFEKKGVGVAFIDLIVGSGMRVIADLIWGGVPQRYPRLRFVIVEGGIGWIACVLRSMDHWWADHRHWMEPRLEKAPSFYFHRQFWATFMDDRAGMLTRELLNVDHLLWSSDYPHTEGVFPHSREQIAQDLAGVPEAEARKILVANAAGFYGLE